MRILLATDGSPSAEVALDFLCSIAARDRDHVEALAVAVHHYTGLSIGDTGVYVAEVVQGEIDEARAVANEAAARLAVCGVDAIARADEGTAPSAILRSAAATSSDLIVIGSRGRGLIAGTLLGSTARALGRHSPIPVLVVRDRREAPRRILVAVDGSPDSDAAIHAFAKLPQTRAAELVLLHVLPDDRSRRADDAMIARERDKNEMVLRLLQRATRLLPSHVSVRYEIERGPVADRVLTMANAMGADLIVLGSRGHELGAGFLQGTADRVLAGAHCAVLVARASVPVEVAEPVRKLVPAMAVG